MNVISKIHKDTGKDAKAIASELTDALGFRPSYDPLYWAVLAAEGHANFTKALKTLSSIRGEAASKHLHKAIEKVIYNR